MTEVGDFKALLRDLIFVLITIHSSALLLRTLPYHASGYGKPRSERSEDDHPDREG
jgi:hypothetical protein